MPKSLSVEPDLPDRSDLVAPNAGGRVGAAGSASGRSLRVRVLPPPPKTDEETLPLQVDVEETPSAGHRWWSPRGWSAWGVSLVFHCGLLLTLALIVEAARPGDTAGGLIVDTSVADPLESLFEEGQGESFLLDSAQTADEIPQPDPLLGMLSIAEPGQSASDRQPRRPSPFGMDPSEPIDWLMRTDGPTGGGLEGRNPQTRAALAKDGGGNELSERAVEHGLRWLMAHQREDGSWHFNHHKGACRGQCRDPGTETSTTAATALALLPFLGAGYTHTEGEYRQVVNNGIYYLTGRALKTSEGLDFQEGTMYAQGLAAIVLCEAYAMTGDPNLRPFAQGAVDFIVYAQDTKGGGWRYTPGEPGDTTVTGWQLMGLKSGRLARLRVPTPVIALVAHFLDGVQYDDGAQYGYMMPEARRTTTAIGLLCRMYTGWRRTRPALHRGVAYLSEWGPSDDDMYYNYYATQVMRHWEGPEWERWNVRMRDYLIETQAAAGHESGSWYFAGGHGDKGGRLYNTAMAVMILEVYYRYMPLYGAESVEDAF